MRHRFPAVRQETTYAPLAQKGQSTYMVQSRVSVVVISLMVWVSIPHMGTYDPLGNCTEAVPS